MEPVVFIGWVSFSGEKSPGKSEQSHSVHCYFPLIFLSDFPPLCLSEFSLVFVCMCVNVSLFMFFSEKMEVVSLLYVFFVRGMCE